METLIRQIARTYENSGTYDEAESLIKASKDILFVSLSRWNFFRNYACIQDLDRVINQNCFLCFLTTRKSSADLLPSVQKYVAEDLEAYGIRTGIQEVKNGFRITFFLDGTDHESLSFYICCKDGEKYKMNVKLAYIQVPLAYEIRCAELVSDADHMDLQKQFEKEIRTLTAGKNKKTDKNKNRAMKEEKKESEKWIQPSLFDF